MPQETINVLVGLLLFGALHSLMAAIGVKAVFVSLMGQRGYLGLYRLFYNAVSGITFLPLLWLLVDQPGKLIWDFSGGLALLFRGVQAAGLLGLSLSFLQIDGMRFVGISPFLAYLNGDKLPLPEEPLATGGVYALVRHPLYLFSLMVIWFMPQMNAAWLGMALGSTMYFAVGSLLEERRLRRQFGAAYADYQRRVAWMIPFVKLPAPKPTMRSKTLD